MENDRFLMRDPRNDVGFIKEYGPEATKGAPCATRNDWRAMDTMDLTQREEQVVTADDTVSSLGLVFVNLPPLPPPPMIVKHVHSGT